MDSNGLASLEFVATEPAFNVDCYETGVALAKVANGACETVDATCLS
jgi:hypothetical protein